MTKLQRLAVAIPLLFAYFQAVRFCCDSGVGWQLVEVSAWKPQLVTWGFPLSPKDLAHALNWRLMEDKPRMTRPLSNLFELFDTPFRAMLWRVMTPPPSLSLTWPFSLVAAPLLLFLLLRRLGIDPWIAVLAISMYLANPGALSFVVMLFRPGKALANVAILFCLWLAARQNNSTAMPRPTVRFAGLCLAIFISFFFDEVALILFPAIILLFPGVVFQSKKTMAIFLMLPLGYIAAVKWGMPALSSLAGHPVPQAGYFPEDKMLRLLSFSMPAKDYATIAADILGNARQILFDSFGIVSPLATRSLAYCVIFEAMVVTGIAILISRLRQAWPPFVRLKHAFPNPRLSLLYRAVLALLAAFVYEGILMAISEDAPTMEHRIWGLYYYGVFCVIFLVIVLALICQYAKLDRGVTTAFTLAVISATTFVFPPTNQAYKNAHYYPYAPNYLNYASSDQMNRFMLARSDSNLLKAKANELRQSRITHASVSNVPLELSYASYELGLVPQRNAGEFQTNRYFDVIWFNGNAFIHCHH